MIRQVSLIIPSYNDNSKLIKLLTSIPDWEAIPNEIIIFETKKLNSNPKKKYTK